MKIIKTAHYDEYQDFAPEPEAFEATEGETYVEFPVVLEDIENNFKATLLCDLNGVVEDRVELHSMDITIIDLKEWSDMGKVYTDVQKINNDFIDVDGNVYDVEAISDVALHYVNSDIQQAGVSSVFGL